jgi:hypothetical protein
MFDSSVALVFASDQSSTGIIDCQRLLWAECDENPRRFDAEMAMSKRWMLMPRFVRRCTAIASPPPTRRAETIAQR